jgi:hypothetical protein
MRLRFRRRSRCRAVARDAPIVSRAETGHGAIDGRPRRATHFGDLLRRHASVVRIRDRALLLGEPHRCLHLLLRFARCRRPRFVPFARHHGSDDRDRIHDFGRPLDRRKKAPRRITRREIPHARRKSGGAGEAGGVLLFARGDGAGLLRATGRRRGTRRRVVALIGVQVGYEPLPAVRLTRRRRRTRIFARELVELRREPRGPRVVLEPRVDGGLVVRRPPVAVRRGLRVASALRCGQPVAVDLPLREAALDEVPRVDAVRALPHRCRFIADWKRRNVFVPVVVRRRREELDDVAHATLRCWLVAASSSNAR